MTAVLLALVSAVLFGAMTVALRIALRTTAALLLGAALVVTGGALIGAHR